MRPTALALFDIDDTLFDGQSQRAFISYARKRGFVSFPYYASIMFWFVLYKIGLVHSPTRILEYAIAFLKGRTVAELDALMDAFMHDEGNARLFDEGKELIKHHLSRGHRVILTSGSIAPVARAIARALNVTDVLCTNLGVDNDDYYTGAITDYIAYGDGKIKKLHAFLKASATDIRTVPDVWAYTDHHSDLPLLELATHPVAVNPTKKLLRIARARAWDVIHLH